MISIAVTWAEGESQLGVTFYRLSSMSLEPRDPAVTVPGER